MNLRLKIGAVVSLEVLYALLPRTGGLGDAEEGGSRGNVCGPSLAEFGASSVCEFRGCGGGSVSSRETWPKRLP